MFWCLGIICYSSVSRDLNRESEGPPCSLDTASDLSQYSKISKLKLEGGKMDLSSIFLAVAKVMQPPCFRRALLITIFFLTKIANVTVISIPRGPLPSAQK